MVHFGLSVVVALAAAALVFGFWFPGPFRGMAGGSELFLLLVGVDVVCGPALTFVLFNPQKPRRELFLDLSIVAAIQIGALCYGMWTVWEARPLYMPHEVDRFKLVTRADLRGAGTDALPAELQPAFLDGPLVVALRAPSSAAEGQAVLFESLSGGRDFGERPEFYVVFDSAAKAKVLARSKAVADFLLKHPDRTEEARRIAQRSDQKLEALRYLPVQARQDWVAVLTAKGDIAGFLKGDGF